jgi:hypothetical protein
MVLFSDAMGVMANVDGGSDIGDVLREKFLLGATDLSTLLFAMPNISKDTFQNLLLYCTIFIQ